ncbi:MAG: glycosyltransferase [Candidatus Pacebacteria bacterium]|nr:glycosyltransferase [Candidatus Paceibacterota bacterium]
MKALFVRDDPSLFVEGSPAQAQMKDYAQAIGTLHVISRAPSSYHGPSVKSDGTLSLRVLRGPDFLTLSNLRKMIRAIVLKEGIEVVSVRDPFEHAQVALRAISGTSAKLHIVIETDFLSPWFIRDHISRSPQVRMSPSNRKCQKIADEVLPHAQGIRVVSKRIRDSLIEKYGNKIVTPSLIPLPISDTLPPAVQLPGHPYTFVLMAISPLEPEKRIEDILVALARIKDTYPSVGLMIVGDGSEHKRLQHWADVLGLGVRVHFLGDRPDAVGLLRNANAFIQSSGCEGFGEMLVEAALARIPIIASDAGLVGEVFKGYEDILATPPGDPANIAVHIMNLVEDTQLRARLTMKAEQTVRSYLASVHAAPTDIAADLQRVVAG